MKNHILLLALLIVNILVLSSVEVTAQTTSKMYVVENSTQFLEGELIGNEVRDTNGDVCAGIVIVSDMQGLSFQSSNGIVKTNNAPGKDFLFVSPTERAVEVFKSGYEPLKIILNHFGVKLKSGQVWQIKITGDKTTSDLIPISIIIKPTDAKIFIDGEDKGNNKTHQVSVGNHEVRIEREGYKTEAKKINVTISNILFEWKLIEIDPVPVKIKSTPSGAKVIIDNADKGNTPKDIWLYPSKYSIKLTKSGYLDINKNIEVTESENNEFIYTLTKNSSILNLTVFPNDAEIKINNDIKRSGKFELAPNEYKIDVTKTGYLPQTETIKLNIGKTINRSYTLTKNSGILNLTVIPRDAQVLINKENYSGKTLIDLAPSRYKIEISKIGYYGVSEVIEIKLGKNVTKNFTLLKKIGKLQFSISPSEAKVLLKQNGKTVNSWVGLKLLKDIQVGTYSLECSLVGYKTITKEITIKEDKKVVEEIELQKTAITQTNPTVSGCPSTVNYSGKTYHTVKIGNQCWFKENLDVGTMIRSNRKSGNQKDNGTIEKYCYENRESNCRKYGGLYQWHEAMQYLTTEGTQGICPSGWHIPTKGEYEILGDYVGNQATKLIDGSGFSALFAGSRYFINGSFGNLSYDTHFWSSTENGSDAHYMHLYDYGSDVGFSSNDKDIGFSVRCLKD